VADTRRVKREPKTRAAGKQPARNGSSKRSSASGREPLSQEAIVDAALKLIARHGVDALNMRALADALDVSAMAAYYYVDTKEDLLSLCGDAVFARVVVPAEDEGTWDERLRLLIVRQRDAMRRYPGLREALTGVDMEQRRRLEDAEIDILLGAGFTATQAVPAFRTLLSWTLGNAAIESSLRDPSHRSPDKRKALRLSFDRKQKPVMSADDYFNLGLDMVLAGLRDFLEAGDARSIARTPTKARKASTPKPRKAQSARRR
jgi:TetR/AcrR family transcriptional regulator, tetracycline repressor protein